MDDIIVAGNNKVNIERLKKYIGTEFEIKDLGEFKYFLGIEFAISKKEIVICRRKYTLDLLEEIGMLGAKSADTPVEQNHIINVESGALLHDIKSYQRLVGSLLILNYNSFLCR